MFERVKKGVNKSNLFWGGNDKLYVDNFHGKEPALAILENGVKEVPIMTEIFVGVFEHQVEPLKGKDDQKKEKITTGFSKISSNDFITTINDYVVSQTPHKKKSANKKIEKMKSGKKIKLKKQNLVNTEKTGKDLGPEDIGNNRLPKNMPDIIITKAIIESVNEKNDQDTDVADEENDNIIVKCWNYVCDCFYDVLEPILEYMGLDTTDEEIVTDEVAITDE
ncbi:hypothetical protein RF11_13221 [Thelohanellus kitauei]|uniref:Uncharacterized protein n=1 Tax=Thelohanellus kitauei TaxID=669202 RepID=A0A0C2MNF5_THEKT|nr:hypothetical protein RF11_13221 [Thelohanellus kitauei]